MDPLMIFNFVCVCLLAAAALRWGATPERICAATLFTVTFADPAYHLLIGHGAIYRSVDIGHLVMDLAVAAIFIDCHTPFHGVSMIATSIACSRK